MKSLLLAAAMIAVLAVPALGGLSAPANVTVSSDGTDVFLDWDDVAGATRYVVEIEAVLFYDANGEIGEARVRLSYSTVDRAWGGASDDSFLVLPSDMFFADALAAAGLDGGTIGVMELSGTVRVKAMNPGKKAGPQNNPFSAPVPFSSLYWGVVPS